MDWYLSSKQMGAAQGVLALDPKRVLIIEDNRSLETAMGRLLKTIRPEAEVDWATTADEVIEALEEQKIAFNLLYDLVIADITLPGKLSGLDFWNYCGNRYPSIPFLVISGMPTEQYLELTSKIHVPPRFLSKPFSLADCRNAIESLMRPVLPYRIAA